jgi:hypothetical protein
VAITILMISKGRLGYNISGLFGSLRGLPHIWGF